MDKELLDMLDKKLRVVKKCLSYKPYTIIASDDEEIREYFIKSLSNNVNILEDYDLYYPKRMIIHEQLKKGHILLLNFKQKVKEYIDHENESYGEEDEWKGAYNALIGFKNQFHRNNCHAIIIVCDNKTGYRIVKNANLASAVNGNFIDMALEIKQLKCNLLQDNSGIFNY